MTEPAGENFGSKKAASSSKLIRQNEGFEKHSKSRSEGVPSIKQVLPAAKQKEYEHFVRTPFLVVLSGDNEPSSGRKVAREA